MYKIPKKFEAGLNAIAESNDSQIAKIIESLKDLKIYYSSNEIITDLKNKLETHFEIKISNEIATTLYSFGELLIADDFDAKILSDGISSSYYIYNKDKNDPELIDKLNKRLFSILVASNSIKYTYKISNLILENNANYEKAQIISDIRIIFDNNLDSINRCAIVVHDLRINYFNENSRQNAFTISLNREDLEQLKKQIERAIIKEETIQKDYSEKIRFIQTQ